MAEEVHLSNRLARFLNDMVKSDISEITYDRSKVLQENALNVVGQMRALRDKIRDSEDKLRDLMGSTRYEALKSTFLALAPVVERISQSAAAGVISGTITGFAVDAVAGAIVEAFNRNSSIEGEIKDLSRQIDEFLPASDGFIEAVRKGLATVKVKMEGDDVA